MKPTTRKGWRVGDRVAYYQSFGAVILEVVSDDKCLLRFDDDSEGVHNLHDGTLPWRRLRSKKITLKGGW